MTRQERAVELKKRGYSTKDIASIVGWDVSTATQFFANPDMVELIKLLRAEEAAGETENTKAEEIETLDDRLAALEHRAIGDMFDKIAAADINATVRVFESVGKRRTELAKQTGAHVGDREKDMGRAVVININSAVRNKMVKNEHNQIVEVDGRALRTLGREDILKLTSVSALDKIEASLDK